MPGEVHDNSNRSPQIEQSSSLGGDIWRGLKRGAMNEITYDQVSPLDDLFRITAATAGGGYATQEFLPVEHSIKSGLLVSAAISTGHFFLSPGHLSDVTAKNSGRSFAEKAGYVAGRYLCDLTMTAGLTSSLSSIRWLMQGEMSAGQIINDEEKMTYHPPFRGRTGKTLGDNFTYTPIFRQERAESLASYLGGRGQTEKLPELLTTLGDVPEAENVKRLVDRDGFVQWKTRYTEQIPAFEPQSVILRNKK